MCCVIQRKGVALPSFTSTMIQKELDPEEADDVKWAANSLYGGGTDTVRVQHSLIPEIPFNIRSHRLSQL